MTLPSHAERARTLVASRGEGALSTIALDPAGHPYGSHVIYALLDGAPIFSISRLAEHTKNLEADPRASLLVVEGESGVGSGDTSLARGRVTLLGRCARVDDRARHEPAFVARHPSAAQYVGFGDFSFWELRVEAVRYVGGFGRMRWIDASAWAAAEPDPLREAGPSILAHMNEDHADACLAYARALAAIEGATAARMVAVDRYGFDVRAETGGGERSARIAFPAPVASADEVRRTLIAMLRDARSRSSG
jgi:putative heme iron utilization protein